MHTRLLLLFLELREYVSSTLTAGRNIPYFLCGTRCNGVRAQKKMVAGKGGCSLWSVRLHKDRRTSAENDLWGKLGFDERGIEVRNAPPGRCKSRIAGEIVRILM